ncbi:hypothetical protein MUP77_13335 [Candidatus Bathyarchaeota archaeon]|nr:hypothetical protein [Candidatus Bathyarchaeota archaeon]
MTKIREAIKQKKQARIMETQTRRLRTEWWREQGLCGVPKERAIKTMELCNQQCFLCAYAPIH